ncbi:MAG: hypothetical protein RQ733_13765 [Methyloprofundus sp.]|nr:hypothetical protein [Methyloprofundus sp.]
MMPNELPPWQMVYDYFSRWSKRGVWEAVLDQLKHTARSHSGRSETPNYGIIDTQGVKTQYASEEPGFDGAKKVKGHKCQSLWMFLEACFIFKYMLPISVKIKDGWTVLPKRWAVERTFLVK